MRMMRIRSIGHSREAPAWHRRGSIHYSITLSDAAEPIDRSTALDGRHRLSGAMLARSRKSEGKAPDFDAERVTDLGRAVCSAATRQGRPGLGLIASLLRR